MTPMDYTIDENDDLILTFTVNGDCIKCRLWSRYSADSVLVKNIILLMSLNGNSAKADNTFHVIASKATLINLKINNQLFAKFISDGGQITIESSPRKLSVFETRIIGRAPQTAAPYPVSTNAIKHLITPVTDLHTHLSAQVSARDLIRIGTSDKHNILYPVAALKMLKIRHDKKLEIEIPKRIFLPLAHLQSSTGSKELAVPLTSLGDDALNVLQEAMCLSPEGQSTFEEVEKCYYLREPFTKDILLLPEILYAVAEHYKKQGIRYAELSSNAMLDPKWLEIIHDTMPDLEKQTGVQLRFRAGIPRNLSEAALIERIEQYKRIAASPYLVGPDILGYEINKTSRIQKQLEELAQWMTIHQPDDSLQIHAGENAKNPANVREALELGKRQNLRTHIGHSLYGVDAETFELITQANHSGLLLSQFNIDSNLALNNIDFPADVPISRYTKANQSVILGSDGADLYRTSAKQIAMAALFCGVKTKEFDSIHKAEIAYIERQQHIFLRKQHALAGNFFQILKIPAENNTPRNDSSLVASIKKPYPVLRSILESGKRPFFFAGAGGSSMEDVPLGAMKEFVRGIEQLLNMLSPKNIYFTKGRTKKSGVNIELEKAIMHYNHCHDFAFDCVTMLAESEEIQQPAMEHFHTLILSAPLVNLPSAVISFLKFRDGIAFYAGGKNFTRDFILTSASPEYDIDFGLMQDMGGATFEKARIYKDKAFQGADGMIDYARMLGLF